MSTEIITTGGTIDKVYDPLTGELTFTRTFVGDMLNRALNPHEKHPPIRELMAVDSNDMTEEQRYQIAAACIESDHEALVVTHGTDTMVETAQILQERFSRELGGRTVVLTGAMVPFTMRIPESDATANLRHALHAIPQLDGGVHIAMHGRLFDPLQTKKDPSLGRFVDLRSTASRS